MEGLACAAHSQSRQGDGNGTCPTSSSVVSKVALDPVDSVRTELLRVDYVIGGRCGLASSYCLHHEYGVS